MARSKRRKTATRVIEESYTYVFSRSWLGFPRFPYTSPGHHKNERANMVTFADILSDFDTSLLPPWRPTSYKYQIRGM